MCFVQKKVGFLVSSEPLCLCGERPSLASERKSEKLFVAGAGMECPAALERRHRYRGRREQVGIDAIKIVLRILEYPRERLAVVLRSAGRQAHCQALRFVIVAIHEQLNLPAE